MSGFLNSISSPLIRQLKALERKVENVPVLAEVLEEVDKLKSPNNNEQMTAVPQDLWAYVQIYGGVNEGNIEFDSSTLSEALYDSVKFHTFSQVEQLDSCLFNNPFQVFQSLFKTIDYFIGCKSNDQLEVNRVKEALDYLVTLTKTFVLASSGLLENWLKAQLDQSGLRCNKVQVALDKYKKFILNECLDQSNMSHLEERSDLIRSMHLSA